MTPLSIKDLFFLQAINSEVHCRNLDTVGPYHPSKTETTKTILMNQQVIMIMLGELLWKNSAQVCDYLENQLTYDQENDRWVTGKK